MVGIIIPYYQHKLQYKLHFIYTFLINIIFFIKLKFYYFLESRYRLKLKLFFHINYIHWNHIRQYIITTNIRNISSSKINLKINFPSQNQFKNLKEIKIIIKQKKLYLDMLNSRTNINNWCGLFDLKKTLTVKKTCHIVSLQYRLVWDVRLIAQIKIHRVIVQLTFSNQKSILFE